MFDAHWHLSGYLGKGLCLHSQHPPPSAGLKDYKVLKTTQSGYVGYLRDKYTLLPETTDRIAATSITATWRCQSLTPCLLLMQCFSTG